MLNLPNKELQTKATVKRGTLKTVKDITSAFYKISENQFEKSISIIRIWELLDPPPLPSSLNSVYLPGSERSLASRFCLGLLSKKLKKSLFREKDFLVFVLWSHWI